MAAGSAHVDDTSGGAGSISRVKFGTSLSGGNYVPTISDEHNVTSVTALGAGPQYRYRVNFTNSYANNSYSVAGMGFTSFGGGLPAKFQSVEAYNTAYVDVAMYLSNNTTATVANTFSVVVIGDM